MEPIHAFVDSGLLASFIDLPEELRGREVEIVVLPPVDVVEELVEEEEPYDYANRPLRRMRVPGSLMTEEEQAEAVRRREKLIEKIDQKPRRSKEEIMEMLLNGPVATEEEIKMQDEVREHMRRWKI